MTFFLSTGNGTRLRSLGCGPSTPGISLPGELPNTWAIHWQTGLFPLGVALLHTITFLVPARDKEPALTDDDVNTHTLSAEGAQTTEIWSWIHTELPRLTNQHY